MNWSGRAEKTARERALAEEELAAHKSSASARVSRRGEEDTEPGVVAPRACLSVSAERSAGREREAPGAREAACAPSRDSALRQRTSHSPYSSKRLTTCTHLIVPYSVVVYNYYCMQKRAKVNSTFRFSFTSARRAGRRAPLSLVVVRTSGASHAAALKHVFGLQYIACRAPTTDSVHRQTAACGLLVFFRPSSAAPAAGHRGRSPRIGRDAIATQLVAGPARHRSGGGGAELGRPCLAGARIRPRLRSPHSRGEHVCGESRPDDHSARALASAEDEGAVQRMGVGGAAAACLVVAPPVSPLHPHPPRVGAGGCLTGCRGYCVCPRADRRSLTRSQTRSPSASTSAIQG